MDTMIAIALLASAPILAWLAVKRYQLACASSAWVSTPGKILSATVEPKIGEGGYCVLIRYSYEVNGKKYQSNQTDFGLLSTRFINRKSFQTKSGATQYASEALAQPDVQVWFDPANASKSILDRSMPSLFITILGLCSLILVAVGGVFISSQ